MTSTTTNYGWTVPTSSDLVKNGATAISTVGSSVDTALWNSGFGQAGKNKIINGDFRINQRSFTSTATNGIFGFDRWKNQMGSSGTSTFTPQTFTPGTAPVAGYEGSTYAQIVSASQAGAGDYAGLNQNIEDVRTFAGQTVTVSFWAKAASGTPKVGVTFEQGFGSGGSFSTYTSATPVTISTSWARYSVTIAVPSLTGKTIGTSSFLGLYIFNSTGSTLVALGFSNTGLQNGTFGYWGVQVEYGSVATPFQTASGGSPQAELAMCQHYGFRQTGTAYEFQATGNATSTTLVTFITRPPQTLRTAPTSIDYSNLRLTDEQGNTFAVTSMALVYGGSGNIFAFSATVASGLTTNRTYFLQNNNNAAGYFGTFTEL